MDIRINKDGTVSGDLGSVSLKDGVIVRASREKAEAGEVEQKVGRTRSSVERKVPIRFSEK